MLNAVNIYIASSDKWIIASCLEAEKAFHVSGMADDKEKLFAEIDHYEIDLLILDSALQGIDGIEFLKWMRVNLAAPPKVVYLSRGDERWENKALEIGADAAITWPVGEDEFLECVRIASEKPYSSLAKITQEIRLQAAEELLKHLKVSESLKGREYVKIAVAFGSCSPWLLHSLSQRLYPWLAERFNTTPQAVERAMRTTIENAWLKGNLESIQKYFGFTVDPERGKPTNAEFLAMLAAHIYRHINRIMIEHKQKANKRNHK